MSRIFAVAFLIFCVCFSGLAFTGSVALTDSYGKHRFSEPQTRIAVMNWTLADALFDLQVIPVGMVDIQGFEKAYPHRKVPASVQDLGPRNAPFVQVLADLKPQIILIGYSQKPFLNVFANHGRVIYLKNFDKRYSNLETAKQHLLKLGHLTGKEAKADAVIEQVEIFLAQQKRRLISHFGDDIPPVSIISMDVKTGPLYSPSIWLYGANSRAETVMQLLGISPAIVTESSKFGAEKLKLRKFTNSLTDNAVILYQEPNTQIMAHKHWQALSTANAKRVYPVAPTAHYGSYASVTTIAEAVVDALLAL